MFEIRGRVEDDRFVVTVATLGVDVALTTVQIGEDDRGAYALVTPVECSLPGGFRLRLEVEPDPLANGAGLHVFFEGAAREAAIRYLRAQGIDPESVFLVAPNERAFSVYFNSLGHPDGQASSITEAAEPPALH